MICPNCQKDQTVGEQNYGALYTCGSCQAVYFINFDGVPEYGEMGAQDLQSFEIPSEPEGLADLNSSPESLPELGSIEPLVPSQNVLDNISYEQPVEEVASSLDAINSVDNPFESQDNMSAMNSDFQLQNNFELPPVVEATQAVVPPPVAPAAKPAAKTPAAPVAAKAVPLGAFADIAQEISDFGNTDAQLAGLNYDLVVSGIDTQETKNLFKEAIEDSKFAWDAFEIMKSVKNGRVEIKKLSPAKAYLLAKRIQFLDIEKVWKQNVLT
jgi:hypothetical protein